MKLAQPQIPPKKRIVPARAGVLARQSFSVGGASLLGVLLKKSSNINQKTPPSFTFSEIESFDPPYCGCHPDYQSFYHFLETYVEYWKDKEFVNGTKSYFPKKESGFVQKTEIKESFEKLFENSKHIPYWLISYNSQSYPDKDMMIKLIERYKKVKVFEHEYQNHYGGKGSKKGQESIYFIAITKLGSRI